MYLFLAFLLVPIIEIALFIQVGSLIGLWPTLAIVVLTAVIGTWLVRTQGRLAMHQIGRSFNQLNDPTEPLAHGAMILIAGVLMLTPGFFTDAVGFALLLPPVRVRVFRYLSRHVKVQRFQMGARPRPGPRGFDGGFDDGDVIDGDYHEVRPNRPAGARTSGWVQGPDRH